MFSAKPRRKKIDARENQGSERACVFCCRECALRSSSSAGFVISSDGEAEGRGIRGVGRQGRECLELLYGSGSRDREESSAIQGWCSQNCQIAARAVAGCIFPPSHHCTGLQIWTLAFTWYCSRGEKLRPQKKETFSSFSEPVGVIWSGRETDKRRSVDCCSRGISHASPFYYSCRFAFLFL